MKKLLFTLLTFSLIFASCSNDDKDDDIDRGLIIKLEGKSTAYNTIELEWNTISDAVHYIVFYRAEGESEWSQSNMVVPSAEEIKEGKVKWDGDFSRIFSENTQYTLQVKAYRSTQSNSEFALSNNIQVKTLEAAKSHILGRWTIQSFGATVKSNFPKYDEALEDFIRDENKVGEEEYYVIEFKDDNTYFIFKKDGKTIQAQGTYELKDGTDLTLTGTLNDGTKSVDNCTVEVSKYSLVLMVSMVERFSKVNDKGYEHYIDELKKIAGNDYQAFEFTVATFNIVFKNF